MFRVPRTFKSVSETQTLKGTVAQRKNILCLWRTPQSDFDQMRYCTELDQGLTMCCEDWRSPNEGVSCRVVVSLPTRVTMTGGQSLDPTPAAQTGCTFRSTYVHVFHLQGTLCLSWCALGHLYVTAWPECHYVGWWKQWFITSLSPICRGHDRDPFQRSWYSLNSIPSYTPPPPLHLHKKWLGVLYFDIFVSLYLFTVSSS